MGIRKGCCSYGLQAWRLPGKSEHPTLSSLDVHKNRSARALFCPTTEASIARTFPPSPNLT